MNFYKYVYIDVYVHVYMSTSEGDNDRGGDERFYTPFNLYI
jgi:hypothetical protein